MRLGRHDVVKSTFHNFLLLAGNIEGSACLSKEMDTMKTNLQQYFMFFCCFVVYQHKKLCLGSLLSVLSTN